MPQSDHQATLSEKGPNTGDTHVTRLRYGFYLALLFFSFILFILCCVRLVQTISPPSRTLHSTHSFYEPFVIELLCTTFVTLIWVPFLIYAARCNVEHVFLTRVLSEYVMLALLWSLQTGGVVAAWSVWAGLFQCSELWECVKLWALVGSSWLGWISLSALCGMTIYPWLTRPPTMEWLTEHVFQSHDWKTDRSRTRIFTIDERTARGTRVAGIR